ncbi:MAG: glycosyltransferase family 2 protein [Balneolales bacterium]
MLRSSSLTLVGPVLKWVFALTAWMLLVLYLPVAVGVFLLLNLCALLVVAGLQFYAASLPVRISPTVSRNDKPLVSIHIPTYNEPPDLVCDTLDALVDLDYENFEVIVLDNNTRDPLIWGPVKEYCNKLGKRFRFRHVDHLKGYKAGALNVCYDMSSSQAEYILVIDADYKVHPDLLRISLSYFTDEKIALVQFPQAYYNADHRNRGLSDEYEHFFQVYMNMANKLNCVLSTGTISVIRKKALSRVSLWSDRTITEDVDLGLRLHEAGFHGVYVPESLGKGLMPSDLKSLRQQRERWVYGNTQTFFNFLAMSKKSISARQFIGIFTQLTAWVNFMLIPVITLALTGVAVMLQPHPLYMPVALVSVATIWVYLLEKGAFFMLAFRNRGKTMKQAFLAYLVHLGLIWEGSGSWLRFLMRENPGFNRTNKFRVAGPLKDLLPGLLFTLALVISGVLLFMAQAPVPAMLCLAAAPFFLSIIYVHRQIRSTFKFVNGK